MSPTKKNNNILIVCSISKKSVANAPENVFGSNLEFLLPVCSRLDRIVCKTRETNENSFQMPPSTSQCASGLDFVQSLQKCAHTLPGKLIRANLPKNCQFSSAGNQCWSAGNQCWSAGNQGWSAGNQGWSAGNQSWSAGNYFQYVFAKFSKMS